MDNDQEGIGQGYFDRPETKKRLWVLLWGFCIVSVIAEFLLHRHSYFSEDGIDGWFGFYAALGFASCLGLILLSKLLGLFLKKDPGYYDRT